MSASSLVIHGLLDFAREPAKPTLRPNGLDTVSQLFQSSSMHAFARGGRFPGLPNFYITESEPQMEIENMAYEIRVRGEGLADGEDREEDNEIAVTDEGWDQGPMSWLTLDPSKYKRGVQHPHISTLWLLDVQKKRVAGPRNSMEGVWRVSGDHKGILLQDTGLPKGRKRRITVGNQVVSSSVALSLTGTTFTNEAGTFTGWPDARYTALDTSRVQVSDTFLTWDAPPTGSLPGHLTPENAPPILDLFALPWYSPSGFTWNWPWGWSLKSINSEPLIYGVPGVPHLTTLVTEYVPRAIVK